MNQMSLFDDSTTSTGEFSASYANTATLYSDGSANNTTRLGGWGYVLKQGDSRQELSGSAQDTTNKRMELQAVIEGLTAVPPGTKVTIKTDSQYVVDGVRKYGHRWVSSHSFQGVPNGDLWVTVQQLLLDRPHSIEWVKAHSGHPDNERCHHLASEAMKHEVMGYF